MRLLRRRPSLDAPGAALAERDADFDGTLEELLAEIQELTRSNRERRDVQRERRLLRLRHIAGRRLMEEAPAEPEFAEPDPSRLPTFDPEAAHPELPAFGPEELSPGLIRAAILRDGCVLVRGLVPRDAAVAYGERIDGAFGERARQHGGKRPTPGVYEEFAPHAEVGTMPMRDWIERGGGLLAADSPALSFELFELFERARLSELVSGYLGEPALISVHKTTLRKAEPAVSGAWHQDGFFMGPTRSLNLWLALSRCGDVAPGLDILPRRLDDYLITFTEDAELDYVISRQKVQEAAGATPILRPIFEPGDALLFDERFLHQTASDPAMPNPRMAVENWFFGGSSFPAEYSPIAV